MRITINLLPQEYRRKEMTPLAVLLPVLGCITLVCSLGAFWAWTHFGELEEATVRHKQLSDTWTERKPRLDYKEALADEEKEYTARSETIRNIAASRVPWTRKLDELTDVVVNDDDGERYLVWLTSMNIKETTGAASPARGRAAVGDTVVLEGYCYSETNPLKNFNFFHEAVKQSQFFKSDFMSINNPAGQAVGMNDGLLPDRAWTVKMELQMNAPGMPAPGQPGLRAAASSGTGK